MSGLIERKIIGEGSYGCVHKPAIPCSQNKSSVGKSLDIDYNRYISKFMQTSEARKELAEYLVISEADPENEYHLGKPIMCQPDLEESGVIRDINKCKTVKLSSRGDYSLLLNEYGGLNLHEFCNENMRKYIYGTETQPVANPFNRLRTLLLGAHHLLKGIKFFKEHGIVHNDLKPQNILFNPETGKMTFIDFGLTRTKDRIIEASKNNHNRLAIFHWSFPLECAFMNRMDYTRIMENKDEFIDGELVRLIEKKFINEKMFDYFFSYFDYAKRKSTKPSIMENFINEFINGFINILDSGPSYSDFSYYHHYDKFIQDSENSYMQFLDKTIDSIDVFGLGFSLQYLINCIYRRGIIGGVQLVRFTQLFIKMYGYNPVARVTDIDALLSEFETILREEFDIHPSSSHESSTGDIIEGIDGTIQTPSFPRSAESLTEEERRIAENLIEKPYDSKNLSKSSGGKRRTKKNKYSKNVKKNRKNKKKTRRYK